MKNKALHFVIIGCGNLAWHLAKKISSFKSVSLSIYNHQDNADLQKFENELNCNVFISLKSVTKTADYYFICVSDIAIASVAKKIVISNPNGILMHCSGSLPLKKLESKNKNLGVFYPLQTFTKTDKINWVNVPIVVEGNKPESLEQIKSLAKLFSNKIVSLNYHERLQLHLAAVLVNNFTNALFVEAFKLLPNQNETNQDLLMPILKQSVKKLKKVHPINAQTGPAKRKDVTVMNKHLELIGKNDLLKQIYELMSQLIMTQQQNAR